MAIFIASAIELEVQRVSDYGWVKGIMTDPLLFAKVAFTPENTLGRLAQIDLRPIFYHLSTQNGAEWPREEKKVRDIVGDQVVLVLPATEDGLRFVADNRGNGIYAITGVFNILQALAARETGAKYIILPAGRIKGTLYDAMDAISEVSGILVGTEAELVASFVKSAEWVSACFKAGANHVAVSNSVIDAMLLNENMGLLLDEYRSRGTHVR
jgi:transaldolase